MAPKIRAGVGWDALTPIADHASDRLAAASSEGGVPSRQARHRLLAGSTRHRGSRRRGEVASAR